MIFSNLRAVPADQSHIPAVAAAIRTEPMHRATGYTRIGSVTVAFQKSACAWTVMSYGEPVAMFGVVPFTPEIGVPWLLTGEAAEKDRKAFLRLSREWHDQLLSRYPTLRNMVDVRDHATIRWLHWAGAILSDPKEVGDRTFRVFELRNAHVH